MMREKKGKTDFVPVNEALLNVITPMGLEVKRNSLVIGENTGKVYGVVRYPQKVDVGWLSKITNIPSTIVSIGIKPVDNGALISAISKVSFKIVGLLIVPKILWRVKEQKKQQKMVNESCCKLIRRVKQLRL